jgi:hypothetical protein
MTVARLIKSICGCISKPVGAAGATGGLGGGSDMSHELASTR